MNQELARRSILGFGEMFVAFGGSLEGSDAVIRRPNLIGVRLRHPDIHPFFNSVVTPPGVVPPADDPNGSHYHWTVADKVQGRVEEEESAIPCMGMWLDAMDDAKIDDRLMIETPPWSVLGELNERAYGEEGFSLLAQSLRDDRVRCYGVRDGANIVCVAMALTVADDLGIHYVATEETHRRRGLATKLVGSLLERARAEGLHTATLQSSEMGMPIWECLGFRRVAQLRAFRRV